MTTRPAIAAAWGFAALCALIFAPELSTAVTDRAWMPTALSEAARTLSAFAAPVTVIRTAIRTTLEPLREEAPILREPEAPITPLSPPPSADAVAVAPAAPALPEVRRVLLLGASSVQGWFGVQLEERLRDEGLRVRREGRVGTGLVRPDWFDWVAETTRLQQDFRPDLVIAQFGGNDCVTADLHGRPAYFGTPKWEPAFRLRFDAFIEAVGETPLLLVGMQHPQDRDLGRRLLQYNAAMERAAAETGRPYLSTWAFTEGPDHLPQQTVTWQGRTGLQYDPDGIHLSKLGGDHMAAWLVDQLRSRYRLVPKDTARKSNEPR